MQDDHVVQPGTSFQLANVPTAGSADKSEARLALEDLKPALVDLHERLWSRKAGPVLVLLQGLDTAGKDSTLRAVFAGLLPQALHVHAFGVPDAHEAAHDFLWRYHQRIPEPGQLGVFNRSWYEGVLVERVDALVPDATWRRRYDHINHFEALLMDRGVHLLKVFLHVSRQEQADRLHKRATTPGKLWKHNPDDQRKHRQYDLYQEAYQEALTACSTPQAPWHVVPADHKPSRNLAVAHLLHQALEQALDPVGAKR